MEQEAQRVQHIMAEKHLWDRLTTLGPDLMQNYRAIQPYIQQAVNSGVARQIGTSTLGKVMEYQLSINGEQVFVHAIKLTNGIIQLTNAWVKKP